MIGDVPRRAPLRCRFGRHVGQEHGGTMTFQCPRCGGSYFQRADMRDVTAKADVLISAGFAEEAQAYARAEIKRRTERQR